MTETEKIYKNAPAKEAIFDIQLVSKGDILEGLARFCASLDNLYPEKDECIEGVGTFSFGSTMTASTNSEKVGYVLKTGDQKNILTATKKGFRLSRIEPYQRWAEFRDEAKNTWQKYCENVDILHTKRLALRYINFINIPESKVELDEYFTAMPTLPSELQNTYIKHFLNRVTIDLPEVAGSAIITQSPIESQKSGHITIVLDIDVFTEIEIKGTDEKTLWDTFEKLRAAKNNIFEAYITDKVRKLIA